MKKSDDDPRPHFDVEDYAPDEFSDSDESWARRQNYPHAHEKWVEDRRWDQFRDFHESMEARTKLQHRMDMESIGVPPDKIGELMDQYQQLPNVPEPVDEKELKSPKNTHTRRAVAQGLRNRLVRLKTAMERKDINPQDDGTYDSPEKRSWRHHYEQEWQEIERRMNIMGEDDIDDVSEAIDDGEIEHEEFFNESPESRYPKLREIHRQHEKRVREWKHRHPEEEGSD